MVYPNVGAKQGGVQLQLSLDASFEDTRGAIARIVFNDVFGESVKSLRLFQFQEFNGAEVCSLGGLRIAAAYGGVVASLCSSLRQDAVVSKQATAKSVGESHSCKSTCPRRYSNGFVGGEVLRIEADDPELPNLLRCSVPIIIIGSDLLGQAVKHWDFRYIEQSAGDIDNFYVLCAPAESRGRFAYYDLSSKKNPCGYKVVQTNRRVEMRFQEFRQRIAEVRRQGLEEKGASSFYLQNTLLHREEHDIGGPRPVGGFGASCGRKLMQDIKCFQWDWLRSVMGGREAQMCQLFCGMEGGYSPCHYDPQDNIFAQVHGWKRVLLFPPCCSCCLYPWPVHHPQDRQSRVDLECPDFTMFPRMQELNGQGLEAVLGPGDVLHIPSGWWHQIEMLPSPPSGEVVSINFWYPVPFAWYYGDPAKGDIFWDRPLGGFKRVLFLRCIEELIGQLCDPANVEQVCIAASKAPSGLLPAPLREVVNTVVTFVCTVFPDRKARSQIFAELVEGRFAGLTRSDVG